MNTQLSRGLDADGGQVDRHHQLGARHRGAQRVDGAEHQRRGHRQHQGAQIGGDALAHVGRDVSRHGQPDVGEQHQDRAHDGRAQRQPDALAPAAADLGVVAGAEVLGQDGNQRVHHAHQADEDGDVDRGRQRHRRQVGGAGVAGHGGVQHAERDAGPLADQHGPGLPGDATQRGAKARGPGERASSVGRDAQQAEHFVAVGAAAALPQHLGAVAVGRGVVAQALVGGLLQHHRALGIERERQIVEDQE